MRIRFHQNGDSYQRGAILLGALIILLTISLIGATLSSLFLAVTTVAEVDVARAQALYLAEAGVAQAVYQLRVAGVLGGEVQQKIPPTPLGMGVYEVNHDVENSLITSTGKVRGVRRTVQIKYIPF